ncbi:unnamed protein product [Acanthoscelides obtectus]|uniref:Uncharacterized protein n=2 Tax=Acanthoscelides obtectus TaxID=200917 RepID=A0A9P0KFA9_ACAOB|nr:unnamed protein product [Acanthoscelides obtectus]CAK1630676.1 Mitochondrial glutamate carrier 1 [Acanthoscelides obtectus]
MADSNGRNEENFRLLPRILNGGLAGIVGVMCTFPLDLVKTRLQNQQEHAGIKEYKSIADAFKKTLRAEGFLGMYKGSLINLILITPEKAVLLAGNDFFRYHLQTKDGKLPLFNEVMAAAAAGFLAIGITTPMELLKIQMQDAGRINAQRIKS